MMENIKQEALLHHLLSSKTCATNDEFLYSFLLGFRLFLSPRQLLKELSRLSSEDVSRESLVLSAGNMCPKCGQMQVKGIDNTKKPSPKTNKKMDNGEYKREDSSNNFGADLDNSLRRKRRGRNRNQLESVLAAEGHSNTTKKPNVTTTGSRDSGILSAYLDNEEAEGGKNTGAARSYNNNSFVVESLSMRCPNCSTMTRSERTLSRKRQLVHVLHEWVRHFPADFRNKKIMWSLHEVIKTCQKENEELSSMCTEVLDCISRLTAAQESYEQQLTDLEQVVFLKKSNQFRKTNDWMVQLVLDKKKSGDVTEMAQQLCLVETEFLRHVGAEEFLQLFTADGDEDAKTNLGACVRWFNRLSHLVASVICLCRKHKHAKQIITFFVRVANCCFDLSNFNSSMAILTGLYLGPVTRLRKAWDKVSLPELDKLQNVFDPSNNFLKYRSVYLSRADQLQNSPMPSKRLSKDLNFTNASLQSGVASQNENSERESMRRKTTSTYFKFQGSMRHFTFDPSRIPQGAVMVPFLVLLVKDVYFLNHSTETVGEDGIINFEKLHTLSNILRPLEEYKQMTSMYQKNEELQDFLLRAPVQDDDGLYLLSYKREPPANRFEKQQLKSLKGDAPTRRRRREAMTI